MRPFDVIAFILRVNARLIHLKFIEYLDSLQLEKPAARQISGNDILGELCVRSCGGSERDFDRLIENVKEVRGAFVKKIDGRDAENCFRFLELARDPAKELAKRDRRHAVGHKNLPVLSSRSLREHIAYCLAGKNLCVFRRKFCIFHPTIVTVVFTALRRKSMELAKSILDASEKYTNYTANNLSKLVKKKSLSTKENAVALELKLLMMEAGFDEVMIDGLGNVIGRIGRGKKVIALDGHIDTVDIGNRENWSFDPLAGEVKDGYVHGRGSVDQKGGPASFVTAGRILKELGISNDATCYFIGSVMEEDCDGLCWKYIVEEDKIRPDCVIVTEPTNLNIYRGHRGRMEIEVSFYGVSAHGSAPERGKNAIYMASKAALEIEQLNNRLDSDPFLGKGSVTISEFISASPSLCAVADFAKIHLDRRLTWGEDKTLAVPSDRRGSEGNECKS